MDVPERGSGGDRGGLERGSEADDRGETVLERASAASETVLNEVGWPVLRGLHSSTSQLNLSRF